MKNIDNILCYGHMRYFNYIFFDFCTFSIFKFNFISLAFVDSSISMLSIFLYTHLIFINFFSTDKSVIVVLWCDWYHDIEIPRLNSRELVGYFLSHYSSLLSLGLN